MAGRPTNQANNYFAVGKQADKDTEASTFIFLRHLDGTGLDVDQEVASEREGGDGQEVGLRYKTRIQGDGAAVVNARPEIAARLLAWTLGADVATTPNGVGTVASGVTNEHISTPADSLPYLTCEQYWADECERITAAQITSLRIEGEAGRPFKMTAQFMGGGTVYAPLATQTATRETSQPFFFPFSSFALDGVGNSKMTKFALEIRRGIDGDIQTNSLNREDVIPLTFDTDFEGTLKYEDAAFYEKVKFGGAGGTQVPIDLATGSFRMFSQFGAGTTFRYLDVVMPILDWTAARVNKLDPDGKTMYLDITGMGRKTATHQIAARTLIASAPALV